MLRYLLIVFAFFLTVALSAQITTTDRPGQSISASVIKKGSFQIESGIQIEEFDDSPFGNYRTLILPANLYKYGMFKGCELRLSHQFEFHKDDYIYYDVKKINVKRASYNYDNFSGMSAGLKINIFDRLMDKFDLAFISTMNFPSGSDTKSNDYSVSNNVLSLAYSLSEKLSLGANAAYDITLEEEPQNSFAASVILGLSVNDKLAVFIEPYGNITDETAYFDAGMSYLLNDKFQIDFYFGTGINENLNFAACGFSWNISGE